MGYQMHVAARPRTCATQRAIYAAPALNACYAWHPDVVRRLSDLADYFRVDGDRYGKTGASYISAISPV
jgi:hypothetical protein